MSSSNSTFKLRIFAGAWDLPLPRLCEPWITQATKNRLKPKLYKRLSVQFAVGTGHYAACQVPWTSVRGAWLRSAPRRM